MDALLPLRAFPSLLYPSVFVSVVVQAICLLLTCTPRGDVCRLCDVEGCAGADQGGALRRLGGRAGLQGGQGNELC